MILDKITTDNEIVTLTPCKLRNPARLPSKTPKPKGKKEITPRIIELEYIGSKVIKSTVTIPKDSSRR
tara:strand:- start:66 stop:269 length:204 start_codon:yes stop_codon:yes gene_type:complete